jgi:hypothetical protein
MNGALFRFGRTTMTTQREDEFLDAVCAMIEGVIVEHCTPVIGDEGLQNEMRTVEQTRHVLMTMLKSELPEQRFAWANRALRQTYPSE